MPRRPQRLTSSQSKNKTFKSSRLCDTRRGTAASRGYGSRWQKARATYLLSHPLCVHHELNGVIVQATVVDHRVPHKGDWSLFWDTSNWQSLCDKCHNIKTATEDGGFGNGCKKRGAG